MLRLNAMLRNKKTIMYSQIDKYCAYNEKRTQFIIPEVTELVKFDIIISTCISSGYLYSMGLRD